MPPWIVRHYRRYLDKRPWTFCWHATLEGLALSLVVGALCYFLFPGQTRRELMKMSTGELFVYIVIVAPPVETLLLQALPVFIARVFRGRWRHQFWAGVLPFALMHLPEGFGTFLAAGLVMGSYLSFTYVHWRQQSRWTATWTTMAQHAIHNGFAFVLLAVGRAFGAT